MKKARKPLTFMSLFSGAGGADCAAIAAGLKPVCAIEIDSYAAQVYRENFGDHIREEDILTTNPKTLPKVDFLWASPVCCSFSTAKINGKELQIDIDCAQKTADIIRAVKPKYFALENVRGYLYKPKEEGKPREFTKSFKIIYETLKSMGYTVDYAINDAADYGVPQNRDRLILRAKKGRLRLLQPTHTKTADLFHKRWNGWYAAIEDLLPTCKQTFLTERQKESLFKRGFIENAVFIEGCKNTTRKATIREVEDPFITVTSSANVPSELGIALLVDGKGNHYNTSFTMANPEDPSFTVTANMDRNSTKAVLLNGSLGSKTNPGYPVDGDDPSFTVTSNGNMMSSRAIVLERTGYPTKRGPSSRDADEPIFTVRSSTGCDGNGGNRSPLTALIEGADIRALDYRCLARFQTFPDWYKWGKSRGRNNKLIGNAVAVDFGEKVIRSLLE